MISSTPMGQWMNNYIQLRVQVEGLAAVCENFYFEEPEFQIIFVKNLPEFIEKIFQYFQG